VPKDDATLPSGTLSVRSGASHIVVFVDVIDAVSLRGQKHDGSSPVAHGRWSRPPAGDVNGWVPQSPTGATQALTFNHLQVALGDCMKPSREIRDFVLGFFQDWSDNSPPIELFSSCDGAVYSGSDPAEF
jgi:hypothetical protein